MMRTMASPAVRLAAVTGVLVPALALVLHGSQEAPLIPTASSSTCDARVEDLLSRLTLEEKISLVHGNSKFGVAGVPRLGIPPLALSDGPHGVREELEPHSWKPAGRTDDFVTYLPVLMCLASGWNTDLAHRYGEVVGREARQRGKHIVLGPSVNIQRTPLGGRSFEYMGEDPFLASRVAVDYIRGLQSQGVAACVKHFAANNQEWQRGSINVEMDERTLREIYLPVFRAAVQDAGVWAVMGAYNKLRGQHCCHNAYLLNEILKKEWGFRGLVVSDWSGTHDTAEAARNGLDLEMGTERRAYDDYFLARPFLEGLRSGAYPMAVLDDKVRRNLRVLCAAGGFGEREAGAINTKEHQEVARRVAEEGIVLLKNEGALLPLAPGALRTLAVIGDNAVRRHAHGGGATTLKAFYEKTPLEGIVERAGARVNVVFSMGYAEGSSPELVENAVRAAAQADVAVIVAGLRHARYLDDEGSDRKDLELPNEQDALIERVVSANPRTVVVLVSGAAVEMAPWLARVPAVVQAWYPGMEGGTALARILFGDVNPSGKLPCTFPKRLADSPAHALAAYPGRDGTVRYEEGLFVGYRHFDSRDIEPLFAFGHGLSYTTFAYSGLRTRMGANAQGAVATVEFELENTGARAGAEVAQVYVHDLEASLPRPFQELKAFRKLELQPGERRTVSIPLGPEAFAFYDPARHAFVAEAGEFQIRVGSSSRDIRLSGSMRLRETRIVR